MPQKKIVPALFLAVVCQAAPVIFAGFDKLGAGSANSVAARNAYFVFLAGAGTESFESQPAPDVSPGNLPMNFGGGLTGTFKNAIGVLATSAAPGGGSVSVRTEFTGWTINFSQPISALGFYADDIINNFKVFDSGDTLKLILISGGLINEYTIDPANYGMVPGDNIMLSYIAFVDMAGTYDLVRFYHNDPSTGDRFNTDMVTAAQASQLIPEPGTVWLAATGCVMAFVLRGHRRRLS